MNTHQVSLLYGIIFIAVGILGFTPNPIISHTGFFETNIVHNCVHVVLGGVFILGALKFPGHESRILKLLGLGGIGITIVGWLSEGSTMLWVVHVNPADHWLHLGLGVLVLISGFVFQDKKFMMAHA